MGTDHSSSQPSTSRWYRDYLLTDHWIGLRGAKIEDAGFRCERCKRKSQLEVHHLHYNTLWHEKLTDLEVLCGRCHNEHHDREIEAKIAKLSIPPPPKKNNNSVIALLLQDRAELAQLLPNATKMGQKRIHRQLSELSMQIKRLKLGL